MSDIEKWSLNDRRLELLTIAAEALDEAGFLEDTQKRSGFLPSREFLKVPVYFVRFVGVNGEEDKHYNQIFHLHSKWQHYGKLYVHLEAGLDKSLDSALRTVLGKAWNSIARLRTVEPQKIRDVVMNSGVLPPMADARHLDLVGAALERTLEWYCESKGTGATSNEAKNIIFYVVQWFLRYALEVLPAFDFSATNPKVLFYGAVSKWELYFLVFMHNLGADVVCAHSQDDAVFDALGEKSPAHVVKFSRRLTPRPFPEEGQVEKLETYAHEASAELRDTLHADDGLFYRPWQFIDYAVSGVLLQTTADEVFILAPEKPTLRPGWQVAQGHVHVPNIVAKISGAYKDKNKYFKAINKLKDLPKTYFADELPILPAPRSLKKAEYYASLDASKALSPEKLLASSAWPYRHLPNNLQNLIADHTAQMCQLKGLKRLPGEPIEVQRLRVFTCMLQLPKYLLELLQQFDYPEEVPKLVVYNNEDNGALGFEDAVLIRLLASIGLDVVVFNPAGHNDIESYMDADYFNSHRLEELAFNLEFRSRSIMGRYF